MKKPKYENCDYFCKKIANSQRNSNFSIKLQILGAMLALNSANITITKLYALAAYYYLHEWRTCN